MAVQLKHREHIADTQVMPTITQAVPFTYYCRESGQEREYHDLLCDECITVGGIDHKDNPFWECACCGQLWPTADSHARHNQGERHV